MKFGSNEDFAALIEAVRAGDDNAFTLLVDKYTPMINRVISDFSLDERDAFSEMCLSFHKAIIEYEAERGVTFGLYAKICLRNAARSLLRKRGAEPSRIVSHIDVDNIAVSSGVQAMLEHRERSAHFLAVAKNVLSRLEFEVYRYWMLGYKTAEIASALGISPKKVDNAKNRMWKKLRSHLTPED